ncbi:MAG: hypothetical protein ACYC4S_02800 [Rhodoferax sp.]
MFISPSAVLWQMMAPAVRQEKYKAQMPTGSAKFELEFLREIENSQGRAQRSCQTYSSQGPRLVATRFDITRT